jgi:hypothetical protein
MSTDKSPDWRHSLFIFHQKTVAKYKLRPPEIAVFTALLSIVKKDGKVEVGHKQLMAMTGIKHLITFKKARDRLLKEKIVSVLKLGNSVKGCTVYKLRLLTTPERFGSRPVEGES